MAKKPSKSIKEKRAEKHAKADAKNHIDLGKKYLLGGPTTTSWVEPPTTTLLRGGRGGSVPRAAPPGDAVVSAHG